MENVIKNNDLQNVKFDINSEFFVIDANNLEKVSSKLYGFCLDNSHIVLDIKDLHKDFGNEGAYVYVKNDDNIITVKQDFVGCYGIYIFRQDDYFAISNSFMYLVDYLKKNYKLTFNKDYANAFLSSNLETFSCQETIINEIVVLERNAIIKINKAKRSMEIIHKNYQENSLEPDSKEFFASLDMWYFKWTKFIRNLKKKTNNVMVDLTGGFDSRITFLLFLGANINLDEIFINSINDNLYTHKKDYEIASKIANHYNFKLNQGNKFITSKSYYKKQDCINIFAYLKMPFHKQMYVNVEKNNSPMYSFNGFGGEAIRSYWNYGINGLIKKESNLCYSMKKYPKILKSIKKIIKRASRSIRNSYFNFDDDDFDICYFRETSNRTHFGKATLEWFYLNNFCLSPIFDSNLHKLKLSDRNCKDKNLLIAIIFTRYIKDIIKFEFNDGKYIDPKTIKYAQYLNNKYPFIDNQNKEMVSKSNNINDVSETMKEENTDIEQKNNEVMDYFNSVFLSEKTKNIFTSLYDDDLYNSIVLDSTKRQFHPLMYAFPVLRINKFKQDCNLKTNNVNNMTYFDFLKTQEGNLVDINKIKKKYEKVDRKSKLLTILGMKFIIKNKGATKTLVTVEREGERESNLSPR